jgi:asparagine synthase (glutamine-hydrolysing)
MCGFAGVVVWDEKFRVSAETLKRMSAAIAHRGPDGEGIYISPDGPITLEKPQVALAHRRLAILDPDPRSNQPFTDEARRWLVFNGEIYNFRELRAELSRIRPEYVWRTSGDTEVLLVAYSVWGRDVVKHLNGMFAIALWDAPNGVLFLARDRMGQKPLYVAAVDASGTPIQLDRGELRPAAVAFASEVQSLTSVSWFKRDVNQIALSEYLRWGYVPHPLTIYHGAEQVEPGFSHLLPHCATNELPSLAYSKTRYLPELWFLEDRRDSDAIAVTRTREFVCRAVRRQLVSDVPLGCFLSGGIDSSIIALAMTLAAGKDQQVMTFSVGFEDSRYDERRYSAEVARHLRTKHHQFCVRSHAATDLPKLAAAYGEPFGDSSALPTYYLSRETRQYVKVALSGDGGDELFGGYDRYRAMLLGRRIRMLTTPFPWKLVAPIASRYAQDHPKSGRTRGARFLRSLSLEPTERYRSYLRLFEESLVRRLLPREPESRADVWFIGPFDAVRPALHLDRREYLPDDLLTKVDRASMAWALEVRSPFMDHELVEFAANLRTNQLLDSRGGKRMLREAFARDLPASVFNRPKMGFAVPIGDWFRGELRSMLRDTLTASDSFASSNFNMPVVQQLIDDHESGTADHSQRLYALLMLELWWNTQRA